MGIVVSSWGMALTGWLSAVYREAHGNPRPDFLKLRDRVLVVTGAASGMGRAIAKAADREGARLVLADFDGDRLKTTAAELSGEVRHLRADVTRVPEIE